MGNARWVAVAVTVAAAATALVGTPAQAGAVPPDLPAPDSHGITVVDPGDVPAEVDLDGDGVVSGPEERLLDVTLTTGAIFQAQPGQAPGIDPLAIPIRVRLYLPEGYEPHRPEPYPVLYLLHGGNGDYDDWTRPDEGDLTTIVDAQDDFEGIVVMPEGGDAGWYSDWYGWTNGRFRPAWETFHTDQLLPWVDANFNTSGTADGRAIAGLSMGGFGTLKYVAANPGLFSAVGSFSGPADLRNERVQFVMAASMNVRGASIGAGCCPFDGYEYGGLPYLAGSYDPVETVVVGPEAGWPAINPVQRAHAGAYGAAAQGRQLDLHLYTGEGGVLVGSDEAEIRRTNDDLHAALAGVDHRYCRGPGTHAWSFWRAGLEDFLANAYGSGTSSCTDNPGWVEVP